MSSPLAAVMCRLLGFRLLVWGAFCCASAEAVEDYSKFRQWLLDRGVVFSTSLDFGVDPATGLRGLLVTEGVSAGTELFRLPREMVLTVDDVRSRGSTWKKVSASGDIESLLSPVHDAFALFLLEQRSEAAEWKPWTDVLPSKENLLGFPLFWDDKDLSSLEASPLRKVVTLDKDAIGKDHAIVEKSAPGLCTREEFEWARTAVKSRVFGLKSLSGGVLTEEIVAMVPFADFVNHPSGRENARPSWSVDDGIFAFKAMTDIAAGGGVYWDYGFKSNRNSLTRYGFVEEKRVPLTDMPLFVTLTDLPGPANAARARKLELIEKSSSKTGGELYIDDDGVVIHELSLSLGTWNFQRLIGHMRFAVYQPQNVASIDQYCPTTYCTPISLSNEREALKHLAGFLGKLADTYGTTASDDKALLDAEKAGQSEAALSDKVRSAVIIRMGEKKILKGMGNVVKAVDPLFDLSPWALESNIAENWKDPRSDIHGYVRINITELVNLEARRWAKKYQQEKKKRDAGEL